ncbi:MAG: nucleoside triphosphate pyrophosphohydrolase [Chloroflexi bacterium]|nr:nucleoside triphosphate pyrophosphohydrolase [Chloroflexota bacterium]
MTRGSLIVLGLGPGDPGLLTVEARQLLEQADEVYLRTVRHPIVSRLPPTLAIRSFDHVYEAKGTFGEVYQTICEELLKLAERPQGVIYGVPGHPLVAEDSVHRIVTQAKGKGIEVRIVPGLSFVDAVLSLLEVDALAQGLQLVDASTLAEYADVWVADRGRESEGNTQAPLVWSKRPLDPTVPALVCQLHSRRVASATKLTLLELYPHDHKVVVVQWAGIAGKQRKRALELSELDRLRDFDHLTSLYLPALSVLDDLSSLAGLRFIVGRLRAPGGCPWDREQTHESLKPYLLEETYEVLEALDTEDRATFAEELGDLLLQIVLHAQLAMESGDFAMEDVHRHINAKLIRRHPHVFGDRQVSGAAEVLLNWEQIKREEKGEGLVSLNNVPKALPALAYAQSIQRRVARVGFDWPEIGGVLDKVSEEAQEVRQASGPGERARELGDLLFAIVNLARWLEVDAEEALRQANHRFKQRFQYMEQLCADRKINLSELSLEQQDELWEEAKRWYASGAE